MSVWRLAKIAEHQRVYGRVFRGYKPGRMALNYAGVPDSVVEQVVRKGFASSDDCVWILYKEE